jgi:CheY-like chemotaxis protein
MNDFPISAFPRRTVYVDDSPQARQVASGALDGGEDNPHVFVTCSTGEELIVRLRELHPDLILLDLTMRGMNGPDTIDALRKAHNSVPVILVTEHAGVTMIDDYKALGVLGVIYKPLNPRKLKGQIQEYWQEYLAAKKDDQVSRVIV